MLAQFKGNVLVPAPGPFKLGHGVFFSPEFVPVHGGVALAAGEESSRGGIFVQKSSIVTIGGHGLEGGGGVLMPRGENSFLPPGGRGRAG